MEVMAARDARTGPAAGIRTPADTQVYAIGDSHGCVDRLEALHATILADSAERPDGRRVAVYLGDYVDRGPDSRGVIDLLVEAPLPGFERIHLMGNHESFLCDFLAGRGDLMLWMMNGGDATLRSYGVDPAVPRAEADATGWLRAELLARMPETHRQFLDGLCLSHVEGDYLFVHAGVCPGVPLDAQAPDDLLWIRGPFLDSDAEFGKVVVHGHTPERVPQVRANRIGIDTGACYGGPLTALVLEGAERRFLQV
jgi:serine/threonine protein phosphatase 1